MTICRFALALGIALILGQAALDAAPPGNLSTNGSLVEQALTAELQGDSARRHQLLQAAMEESREARWHLGQVEHENAWVNYRDLVKQWTAEEALVEYRKVRGQFSMTSEDQLKLANWCRSHNLPDRERAHLTAALERSKNPDDPVLRNRLGYNLVNGEWRTQSELDDLTQSRLEFRKNLKTWMPKIQKLAQQLNSRRESVREQAEAELKAIDDPAALPALELVFANADLALGRLLVEILGKFPSHQAADSLARFAVLSPWDVVREEAIKQLRSRPPEAYAPELLATLRTPVSARIQLLIGAGGVHLFERFSSETQSMHQVVDRRSSKYLVKRSHGGLQPITGRERDRNRVARSTANATLDAQLQALNSQQAAKAQKEKMEGWNDRICDVLKESTGFQIPPDPEEWWHWWADYNQITEEQKEYEYRCYEEIELEYVEVNLPMRFFQLGSGSPSSCLVAGTSIWTDRGAVPVESVLVGDLVLSKHPETGELAYQPVLRTTIRDPQPVMKVVTEQGEIRGTGGHTFWISGQGWTKLRNVKPGQRFHGANGPVEIRSLKEAGTEKTYNLVVADSHTYFVGPELVLSHDVSMADPVDAIIPGYVKR